jgi:hypothetical protein
MGLFGGERVWFLTNRDSGEELQGQFVAESLTETIGATYADRFSLNAQSPISQFVHGNADTASFRGRFFLTSELEGKENDPYANLALLKSWVRRDEKLKRPPLIMFWVADSHLGFQYCTIRQISNEYQPPTRSGALRDVSFSIELQRYEPWTLDVSEPPETRYHRSRQADYYEMLTQREYGSPLMGDVIRKRHPSTPFVQIGSIIKLPSSDAIAKEVVEPKSLPLYRAFTRKDTDTKRRREQVVEDHNVTKSSFYVREDE